MEVLRKAFKQALDPLITRFVSSIEDDKALIQADLKGSIAHVAMLVKRGLISESEGDKITSGLMQMLTQAKNNKLDLKLEYEDVHMNVEKQLESLIGKDALRMHTARSRNDQVALDMRLFIIEQIEQLNKLLIELQKVLLSVAKENDNVIMPGYTHLQRAQPIVFAHAMLAFFEMFMRDISRFTDAKKRTAISPLGAGALAGSRLPIDPKFTADKLGFEEHFANSLDAVCDRDFIGEFLFAACLTSSHLSQLAETLIIWSSKEFNFISFPDNITTSSSLMPQKKNADPIELIRAKNGIALGELVNFLTVIKGLPIGYNRDLQETKPPAIRVADCLAQSLAVIALALKEMQLNKESMLAAANDPELMATDLVEYLVAKGMPFRQGHEVVAELVQLARENKVKLTQLSISQYKTASALFEDDLFDLFDPQQSLAQKTSRGSTGLTPIKEALQLASDRLQKLEIN